MTEATLALFKAIANDLGNWGGMTPCFNHITAEGRGNLTDLKRKGFVKTFKSDGEEWISLTDAGKQMAVELGINI